MFFFFPTLLMSSAYHPQIDGKMERTQRTLEQTMHCLLSEGGLDESQWYTLLLYFEFSMNFWVSSSINLSLAELVFGQKLLTS